MKIQTAEYMISAVSTKQYPEDGLPDIAMAGRSNVGKSSFINRLINRKNLVRTSSNPGKTRTINFFRINESFYFVDVPGYGYAKVSKQERAQWGHMMEEYFGTRNTLKAVVLIVDLRHGPTRDDLQMAEYINYLDIPLIIIATKLDKISNSKRAKAIKQTEEAFSMYKTNAIIPFSAETNENKTLAWQVIESYLA